MNFQDSLQSALKDNVLNFEGRASRSEYWWFLLFYFIVMLVGNIFIAPAIGVEKNVMKGIVSVIFLIPMLSVSFRRMHDLNRRAWWLLFGVIPFLGFVILTLFFFIRPGTEGTNRFGPDPLSGSDEESVPPENIS